MDCRFFSFCFGLSLREHAVSVWICRFPTTIYLSIYAGIFMGDDTWDGCWGRGKGERGKGRGMEF